jgi:hypothetical protein
MMFLAEPDNRKGLLVVGMVSLRLRIFTNLTWQLGHESLFDRFLEFAAGQEFKHVTLTALLRPLRLLESVSFVV